MRVLGAVGKGLTHKLLHTLKAILLLLRLAIDATRSGCAVSAPRRLLSFIGHARAALRHVPTVV